MSAQSTAPPTAVDVRASLKRAFSLGQTYWQQADSESYSQNAKSDVTLAKFNTLVDEVCAVLAAPQSALERPLTAAQIDDLIRQANAEWDRANRELSGPIEGAAVRLVRLVEARYAAGKCSTLCAVGEPCSVTADGKCDAWCSRCGCGNNSARYAHLKGCPASLSDAEIDEAAHEVQRVIVECGGEPTEFAYDYLRAILAKLPPTGAAS